MNLNSIQVPLIGMGLLEFFSLVIFIVLAVWLWGKVAKVTG